MRSDQTQTTGWQPIETAPKDRCIRVQVPGWGSWVCVTFDGGAWLDANGSPVDAVNWSEYNGEDADDEIPF